MPSAPTSRLPVLERTSTWPPTIRVVTDGPATHKPGSEPASMSAVTTRKQTYSLLEDDLDEHPEDHFLSPMAAYEYEDWADDSEDDQEVEWDAGITDFALFNDDIRRAQEEHDSLPSKWEGFVLEQQSALSRSSQRSRTASAPDTTRPPLPVEDVPGLTPDSSPSLRDDLEVVSEHAKSAPIPIAPRFLTVKVTPPEDNESCIESDDELPLSFYIAQAGKRRQERRRLERPGLQYNRTLSGKVHVWRRPSWHIYPVGEDADAERRAELSADTSSKGGIERGRR